MKKKIQHNSWHCRVIKNEGVNKKTTYFMDNGTAKSVPNFCKTVIETLHTLLPYTVHHTLLLYTVHIYNLIQNKNL